MDNSISTNVLLASVDGEKIQAQLEALTNNEDVCHFFCIQLKGQECNYYGFESRPFYDFDQAKRKVGALQAKYPNSEFYVQLSTIKTSALNFEDDSVPMWEKVWLNKHDWRLAGLKTRKMSKDQLKELIPNYDSVMAWQEKHNTKDTCHYYFCASYDDEPSEVPTSSAFTFNIADALAARLHFTKTMPGRKFHICSGLMTTQGLLSMDGGISNFQKLVDAHKARLSLLEQGDAK